MHQDIMFIIMLNVTPKKYQILLACRLTVSVSVKLDSQSPTPPPPPLLYL